jgi:hypothetical protein
MAKLVGVWGTRVVAMGTLAGRAVDPELGCIKSLVGVGGTLPLPAIGRDGPEETRLGGNLGRAMGIENEF